MRRAKTAPQQIEQEIACLGDLSRSELVERWRALYGCQAPKALTRDLLVRGIAYKLQERAFGSLDRNTARMLDRIARSDHEAAQEVRSGPRLKPGTLLVREWQGQLHRVMVMDDGFAWNGSTYASLSEIARAITGTRWNGPLFFGLRATRAAEASRAGAINSRQAPADARDATSAGRARARALAR